MTMIRKILCLCTLSAMLCACTTSREPVQENYTVPSWTLYQRALTAGQESRQAKTLLVSRDYPYNISITVNGDPSTRMGVAWFTNSDVSGELLQVVEGKVTGEAAFSKAKDIPATGQAVEMNYVSAGRNGGNTSDELMELTGFTAGEKRSYLSNKVLIDGLKPATTYSFRVGKKGAWSDIGTFTTATGGKEPFEFIYITDTQSNTDEMFETSKKTVEAANNQTPDAKFLLITGDLVESEDVGTAEWEYEQWFEKMQNTWLHLPIVPIQGNHDISASSNWHHHFNTSTDFNARQTADNAKTAMEGTVYSFVWNDALFLVVNFEDLGKGEPYFDALEKWMRAEVAAHPSTKWRITAFHRAMFTGSSSHQSEREGRVQGSKIVRDRFAGLFEELQIDLALQGHDHVYAVVGPIHVDGTSYTRLTDAISDQQFSTPTLTDGATASANATGISGGTYNVSQGTIYMLNNSAGEKKYFPRTKQQMEEVFHLHGVSDYWGLFNRLGQTGEPTYSRVKVSDEAIEVDTYTMDNNGRSTLFDQIRIVK